MQSDFFIIYINNNSDTITRIKLKTISINYTTED